jgi:hypothetical protein
MALPLDSMSCFRGTPRAAAFSSTAAIRRAEIMVVRSAGRR